ncbi:MAG TPA: D-glycero-beta-D-manno-heptose 1-phosphate adenylyltransferase [Caldithrix abyssi]|uniref:D-glycero-beta-D-manno-heptose 1-phosphate adenylyltransferase n=1 Tax=Caldithrix abyssi TaxID=187145 RepID=A0A7V5PNC4_CALAY|nr:D-glycero-beta-D-manno-heptose 1-phosphate adenylyltransferase [Caldithrix abyssi]
MSQIVAYQQVPEFMRRLRTNKGIKIAFTNGCFDLLHRGHVEYLEQARAVADFLFVGLNSDASVRRLKGRGRPLMSADDRAYILSRLRAVDAVCIFEQDTPLELIQMVRPDFLIKGGDYRVEDIVGRDFVESYGGQVHTIPLIPGRSTTGIIEKIKSQITNK